MKGWEHDEYFDNDDDTPMNNFTPIKRKNGGKKKRDDRGKALWRSQVNKRKVFEKEEQEYENYQKGKEG